MGYSVYWTRGLIKQHLKWINDHDWNWSNAWIRTKNLMTLVFAGVIHMVNEMISWMAEEWNL